MISEVKNIKRDSRKVCSETTFFRNTLKKSCRESPRQAISANLRNQNFNLRLLHKKYSKSLNDLLQKVDHEHYFKKGCEVSTTIQKKSQTLLEKESAENNVIIQSNKVAGRCILNLLLLNAWRKQKVANKLILEKLENLNQKVDGYEMQVYLLRQLLNAEKSRVETSVDNVQYLLQKLDECQNDKKALSKKSEELENKFNDLVEYCAQIEDAFRNQENDIITSRLEAENWEKQLRKEREKLKKIEGEETVLKEKIKFHENEVNMKTEQLEQLSQANRDVQQKLDVQVTLWGEAMAQVDLTHSKLKEAEIVKHELQKTLKEKDREIKNLQLSLVALEKKLQEEDERNGILGKTVLEKSNELTLLQNKLKELSESHYPWSGGIVKMASLCAKIPVACICTVGSLLLPFPTYRL